MTEKVDYYDIVSTIVPGALLVYWIPICFPALLSISGPNYPEAFTVIVLTSLSILLGQLVQAIGSIVLQPVLFFTWGGKSTDKVFSKGLAGYLPKEDAARIKKKLQSCIGEHASDPSLFACAIQYSDAVGMGRAAKFNSLYAYHRGLFTLLVIATSTFFASASWGAVTIWQRESVLLVALLFVLLLILVWYRTKQRDHYFVKEVLLTAERVLDENKVHGSN